MKKLLIFILCLIPSLAVSAPSITGVSGSLTDGQTVTISGSSFGSKSPAAPVKWDNFEGGTNGNTLENNWVLFYNLNSPKYSIGQIRTNSTLSVLCDMTGSSYDSSFGLDWRPPDPQAFYVTYWRYDDMVGTPYNYKPMRFYGNVGDLPQAFWAEFSAQNPIHGVYDVEVSIVQWLSQKLPTKQWMREEYWLYAGTQGGNDGVFTHWVNGVQNGSVTGATQTFLIGSGRFSNIRIGHYASSGILEAYIDDVYIDNTLARVELCDASTWASRTHCEIQYPTSWADESIGITVNGGSFVNGNTVYLYVVDSSGAQSVASDPIVLGGEGGGTTYNDTLGLSIKGFYNQHLRGAGIGVSVN